jgi:hypothetical protein
MKKNSKIKKRKIKLFGKIRKEKKKMKIRKKEKK